MDERELKEWGEKLLHDVGQEWQKARADYPHIDGLKSGWDVFYSPLRMHPNLMIIGINPGGGTNDFDEKGANRLPTEHGYFDETLDIHGKHKNDYPLARKTVKLFGDMKLTYLLKESVKLNLLFFRSRCIESDDKNAWHKIPEKLRRDLESFCSIRVLEIIKVLRPRIILAESKDTYHKLRDLLQRRGLPPEKEFADLPRCYAKTRYPSLTLIGICHLTSAHIRSEEREKAKKLLEADLSL